MTGLLYGKVYPAYNFAAYSDSNCTTELADVWVETPPAPVRLTAIALYLTEGKLTIAGGHTTDWYYKADSGPHSTCQGPVRWNHVNLSGLATYTTYTYTAYSDSACTAANQLGSPATFKTRAALYLTSLATSTADFSLDGYAGAWWLQADAGPDSSACNAATLTNNAYGYSATGLATSTRYSYTAYTDSNCSSTSTNFLSSVAFRTLSVVPTLTVSYVTPTTAKVSISDGSTRAWFFSSDDYRSGGCFSTGDRFDDDPNARYLRGLTPGATYTFTAYISATWFPGYWCAVDIGAAPVTFTAPAVLPQCEGLSIEIQHTPRATNLRSIFVFNFIVSNTTDALLNGVKIQRTLLSSNAYSRETGWRNDYLEPVHLSTYTLPRLEPGSTIGRNKGGETTARAPGELVIARRHDTAEMNASLQLMSADDPERPICETVANPLWVSSRYNGARSSLSNPLYGVSSIQLDNPLALAGENTTATVTVFSDPLRLKLTQACVNLHFDGLAPVDADGDGHHDVVFYDGPNGRYNEDGTWNGGDDGGFPRSSRLEYDSDGYDEDRDDYRYRPQCSDAGGKFEGGLFRIGSTNVDTRGSAVKWPTFNRDIGHLPLTYTVKVPVTRTGAGPGCVTATMRALPAEISSDDSGAYEKAQNDTATACLGPPPSGDPELPFLLQSGRADLMTLHKCADGVNFPCEGKSAGDLVQYVAGEGADDHGNAAENAGSPYRAFQTEDVMVHVQDASPQRQILKDLSDNTKTGLYWLTGNPVANFTYNDAWTSEEYGIIPGVSVNLVFFDRTAADKDFTLAMVDKTPGGWPGRVTVNTAAWGKARQSWSYWLDSALLATNTVATFHGYSSPYPNMMEFGGLGTYVVDLTMGATHTDGNNVETTSTDKATYTFHVGPAADLSVRAGGSSASVEAGKRAFTILAESEATAEIDAEIYFSHGFHGHYEQVNLQTLIPAVTVTSGGAAIPAASISQAAATAGSFDAATGVWTFPDGFQGTAALTLVADAGAVSSVTAEIANSAEVCEDTNGNATSTVEGRAAVDKASCEVKVVNNVATSTGNHWGSYQRCFKATTTSPFGLDPDSQLRVNSERSCKAWDPNNTWQTTEVLDWRPKNNTVTFSPDAAGFTLNARGGDRTSINLRWHKQAGADEYAIYSASTADLADTANLGAVLSVNQVAIVSGDTTEYFHDGLSPGQKRHYLVRARKDGRPFAMSSLASAAAQVPTQSWPTPPASRAPGSVGNLTAARTAANENVIQVNWTAPSGAAPSGYDVEYRSRAANSGPWPAWSSLAAMQPATSYTLYNAGGGTGFQFRVRALNIYSGQTHNGSWGNTSVVMPVASPDQVGNLLATRKADDASIINVSWNAPSGGTAPTGYGVEQQSRAGSSGAWSSWSSLAAMQTSTAYTVTGAGGGTSYRFRVRTATVSGSDTIYGSWRTSAIVPPLANPDQVGNLQAARDANNETIINVSWTAPSGGTTPTGYGVEYQLNGGSWTTATTSQTGLSYTVNGAAGASSYRFRVRTVTVSGSDTIYGSWSSSNTVARMGAPGQVGNLSAARDANDETIIDVTWTAPSNATGRTSYDIQRQQDGGSWSASATTSATTTGQTQFAYRALGAAGGSRHLFRVRAVTTLTTGERLEGNWRNSNTVARMGAPGQVGNLSAVRDAADETAIDVTWTAPSNATGRTSYEVQNQQDGGAWSASATTTATTTGQTRFAHREVGVAGGSRYVFRVRAVTTLTTGERLEGGWRNSNTVRGLPAGNIATVTATPRGARRQVDHRRQLGHVVPGHGLPGPVPHQQRRLAQCDDHGAGRESLHADRRRRGGNLHLPGARHLRRRQRRLDRIGHGGPAAAGVPRRRRGGGLYYAQCDQRPPGGSTTATTRPTGPAANGLPAAATR